jgi:DNA repair exonuclease SbcCD nuclease subunit
VADRTIRRLCDALKGYDGPWVLLPGNHDAALAESVWTRLRDLGCCPANVHPALTPEPLDLAEGRLTVLPAPLQRRHEAEDLTAWFDDAPSPEGAVRVGLAHGTVLNRLPEGAEQHNPIADNRADAAKLNYLALGDWHGTLEIAPRTWYAGAPETDGFRDNDPGNVLLVEVDGPGAPPRIERIPVTHYQWHAIEETVGSDEGLDALDARLHDLGGPPDRQVVRLKLSGTASLSGRESLEELLERWRARFHYLDVDTSELRPEATEADLASLRGQGFLGDAVDRLLALRDSGEPDSVHALDALQRVFLEYRRATEGGD